MPDSVTVLVQEVDKIERELNERDKANRRPQQQETVVTNESANDLDDYREASTDFGKHRQ
jgi:hypothetical protein